MSKTDLLFARTREAIEAHLTIVFAALAVSRIGWSLWLDRVGRWAVLVGFPVQGRLRANR